MHLKHFNQVGNACFGGKDVGVGLGHARDDGKCCVAEGDGDVSRALGQAAVQALWRRSREGLVDVNASVADE